MINKQTDEELEPLVMSLDTVRDEILNTLLFAISIFALLPLIASFLRIPELGWQPIMYAHIIAYSLICVVTLCHRTLRYFYKASVLISFSFFLGCAGTLNMGLIGSGIIFMVFSLILATMFFGIRQGIILTVAGLFFLVATAFGVKSGWIGYNFNIELAALSFSSWLTKIFVFALFSVILIFSLGRLINYLVDSSQSLKERTLELRQANDKLMQEIAEKKIAEEALQKSESKYRLLAENATDVIWTTDLNFNLTYISPSVERFRGYSVEEAILQKPEERIVAESLEKATQVLAEESELESNQNKDLFRSRTIELEAICKDGSTKWSETKITFIRDSAGKAIGILGVSRDITEQKQAAEEKRMLEARLTQSQKMEAIGTLAGGIAHDFNNILAAIIGYNELLQINIPRNSTEFEYSRQIQQAGNRAKELVEQILTFSRQTEHTPQPVEVNSVLKEVTKLLRSTLPTTIEIRQNIQGPSLVTGDPTQIHQIIMNLCTNAGHAMQAKGGFLTIDLQNIELKDELVSDRIKLNPGFYVQLSVSDTGSGIPVEILDRIFDPFFTTKERGQGTGMGLSVVHGIVESYKGAIHVYSEEGEGTTFRIYLPAIERRAEPEKREIEGNPKGTEHILLVDDEQVIVELGRAQLETLGYKVSTRSNSIEALALFRNKPESFDLIITDMTMPQMTGEELAKEIKRIKPNIPVILCTGFSSKIASGNFQELGVDALLMKPIIISEMAGAIRKVLDKK